VVLHRAAPVGLLQLVVRRVAGHAEDFVVVTLAHARGPGTGDRGPVGITASCFILFRSIKTRGRGQVTRNRTSMVPGPRSPGPRLLLLLAVVLDLGELGVHDVLGGRSALAAGGF